MAILSSKISFHFFKRWGLDVWHRLFYNSKSSCLIFRTLGWQVYTTVPIWKECLWLTYCAFLLCLLVYGCCFRILLFLPSLTFFSVPHTSDKIFYYRTFKYIGNLEGLYIEYLYNHCFSSVTKILLYLFYYAHVSLSLSSIHQFI